MSQNPMSEYSYGSGFASCRTCGRTDYLHEAGCPVPIGAAAEQARHDLQHHLAGCAECDYPRFMCAAGDRFEQAIQTVAAERLTAEVAWRRALGR